MTFDAERLLDEVGWHILDELQADARLSMAELGRRVGLSAPAAAERVRKLEDAGVISGYRAQVNLGRAGRPLLAFVRISAYGDVKVKVAEVVNKTPEVLEAHRGTGSDCFILKVAVRDIPHLEQVTDRFTMFGQLTTSIVLSSPLEGRVAERLSTPT
ncbi:AsnC family transcriptional regulator (plasmid) [Deinococcus aetherius]|uniref:AsnC family transcriptional regulator n=1 Tax=Deinococcus aetherius TaxID=200252 RepID=A0ABM8AKZ1_9DEIO|nr:Lrp/AsnC family transcriptional regulator [Deinococcus aetherius]BDP44499.1 AsnC family transcriptional regulator [Deinococcus aetherius]